MINEQKQGALRRLMLVIDGVLLPVSLLVAFGLHGALRPWVAALKDPPQPGEYAALLYLAAPLWLTFEVALGLHRLFERRWSRFQVLVGLIKLHALGFVGVTALLFLSRGVINRSILVAFLAVNLVAMLLVRLGVIRWLQSSWRTGRAQPAWLFVGTPAPEMAQLVKAALAAPWPPQIVGVLGENPAEGALAVDQVTYLGTPETLATVLHDQHVDLVVFFPPFHHADAAGELLRSCERLGIAAAFSQPTVHRFSIAPHVMTLGDSHLITYEWSPPRPSSTAIKSALDVLISGIGLIVISPLLLLISLAILVRMGRPVLFSQQRVGLHGRRFKLHKFRTMVNDAEAIKESLQGLNEMSGPVFKIAEDPRVLPLGRFLRRWSLDELPQLFNVVSGDMSLVGPRPLPVAEQQEIEGWYRRRLSVKPGITCLWQISGRNNIDFEQWMKLDLRYVDQWSLSLDARILLLTLPAVLSRRGAS